MDSGQINRGLDRMLGFLGRRGIWIVLCALIPAAVVYYISKQQPRKYTATASLVFNENPLSQQVANQRTARSANQQAQRGTNVKLVQLGDTAARTASRLPGLTGQEVSAAVKVSGQRESNIVDVSATTSSPALAARIANAYVRQFVSEQRETSRTYYKSALRVVAKELAPLFSKERATKAGPSLHGLAQSLGELADLRNGSVRVVQAATTPTSPSSPRVARNTILAAALGLLLGLAVTLLLERFDWRIREPDELAAIFGRPVLGYVPESRTLVRASEPGARASSELLPSREAEAFDLIRARLRYFDVEREPRTLLVTSAEAGAGKTTIARQLAMAAASMGSTVLLVEADLRNPSLAPQLDIAPGPGVADVVTGSVSLWSATQPVAIDQPAGPTARPLAFDVLVAGAWSPPNPAELIEGSAMAALLEQARATYDLVVVDTSPLSVPDAFPLLRRVDGVVVVARMGSDQRPATERLRETLDRAGAPLLGVIANGVRARGGRDSYYAEADDGTGAFQGAADVSHERVVAEAERPDATKESPVAPTDGAQVASSARAGASADPLPGPDS